MSFFVIPTERRMSFFRHSDGAAHELFSSFRTRNAEESRGKGQSAEGEGIPRLATPHFGMTAGRHALCSLPPCKIPQKCVAFLREPYSGEKGGIVNAENRVGIPIPQSLRDSSLCTREPCALCSLPPLQKSRKNALHFCGSPIRGDKGGIVMHKAGAWQDGAARHNMG